jgi:CDK inhibitor PHO81
MKVRKLVLFFLCTFKYVGLTCIHFQFGKQIQSQQFTEWSPYYLDYKGLKKFISSLLNTPADSLKALGLPLIGIEEDRAKLLQSQKAAFFFKLERELEKVNFFFFFFL